MKDTPEYKSLKKHLESEPAGSPRILALAHYAEFADICHELDSLRETDDSKDDVNIVELLIQKAILTRTIKDNRFTKDAVEYIDTFENAGDILKPYYEKSENPEQEILDDLKEINVEKARKRRGANEKST